MALNLLEPTKTYDRTTFVKSMKNLSDLEEWAQVAEKDPFDPEMRRKVGILVKDDASFYDSGYAPDMFKQILRESQSDLIKKVRGWTESDGKTFETRAGYVETNYNKFLKKLSTEDLVAYMQNVPLCKTGKEDVDKVVKLVKDARGVNSISHIEDSEERINRMREYVADKLENAPEHIRAEFQYSQKSPDYIQRAFASLFKQAGLKLGKELTKNDKLDRDKIEMVIRESMKVAREQFDKTKHLKDKSDLYDAAIAPYYEILARRVYPNEKKEEKEEFEKERVKQAKERKSKGLPL